MGSGGSLTLWSPSNEAGAYQVPAGLVQRVPFARPEVSGRVFLAGFFNRVRADFCSVRPIIGLR